MKRYRWWLWWSLLPVLGVAQPEPASPARPVAVVLERGGRSTEDDARLPSFVLYDNNQVLFRTRPSANAREAYLIGTLAADERERFDEELLPVLQVEELAERYVVSSAPGAGEVLLYLAVRSTAVVTRVVGLGRVNGEGRIPNYATVAESGLPEPVFNLLHHVGRIRPLDAAAWKPTEVAIWLRPEPKATRERGQAWPETWAMPVTVADQAVSRISLAAYGQSGRKTRPTSAEPLWFWWRDAGWTATVIPAAPLESIWMEAWAAAEERLRAADRTAKVTERLEAPVGQPAPAQEVLRPKVVDVPTAAPSALEVPVVPLTLPGSVPTP